MTVMLVTLGQPLVVAPLRDRDRAAGAAAAESYQAAFERLDRMARQLRAERWAEGAETVQQAAEIAYFAARRERRSLEDDT